MIYTLTTNPAIDMNICSDSIEEGRVNRTSDAVYTPNGKGLNVSFVLGHYGVKSKITGFFGGFSGEYIVKESEKRGFEVVPIWVEDTTRINIFLNDGRQEYKFVNEGSFIPEDKQDELIRLIRNADDMEVLSISGSLPRGVEPDYYDRILAECEQKGTKVILDISSHKLKELLRFHPILIKPNDEEIEQIFGIQMKNETDIVSVLDMLHKEGAENVLLTLGDRGAYFSNGSDIYFADTYPIKLLSSACAGDSALAAFLSVWLKDETQIEEALKLSAATGANVAESPGIGDLKQVDTYKEKIQVRKVR